jgi:hypothetical protein
VRLMRLLSGSTAEFLRTTQVSESPSTRTLPTNPEHGSNGKRNLATRRPEGQQRLSAATPLSRDTCGGYGWRGCG